MEAARAASAAPAASRRQVLGAALLRHGLSGRQWPRAWADAAAARQLRRGHHRRRRARPGRRLLPGRQPRDHQRRRAGQGLHRRRRLRPQHRHPAVQLPDPRGRPRSTTGRCSSTGTLAADLGLQRDVLPARAPHPGPQRLPRCAPCAGGPRSTSCRASTPRSSARPRSSGWCRTWTPRPRTRYPILGALYHPPGGIIRHDAVVWGYARGRRRPRRAHPPGHRGHRHRRGRRPGARRADQPAATSPPRWCSTPRRAGPRWSPPWPACGCRSRRSRCRPRSPSRSGRSWTRSSCRAPCTCT